MNPKSVFQLAILLAAIALMAVAGGCSQRQAGDEVTSTPASTTVAQEPATEAPTPELVDPTATPRASRPTLDSEATVAAEETDATTQSVYVPLVDQGGEPAAQAAAVTPSPESTETPTPQEEPQPEPTSTVAPMNLADWPAMSLAEWPRPLNDNGLCIHNITEQYYHEENLDMQVARLQQMNMRWTVMLYGDEFQLQKAAPRFRDAGITVVWRKMLRSYERYYDWGRDIALLKEMGMPPYMQIYNEPSLRAEWGDREIDREMFLEHFISAVQQVYDAGGYVGLQFVSDDWLRAALQEIKRRGGEEVFGRMFLVPHPYGLNHPPDYTEDSNGVLGFLRQAEVVEEEIGFVPPMIAGEGGWKWNATDDNRFPAIDAELHRDYHLAVFDWFRTGVLSNGEPLPDYLFAFCPWLLSSKLDDSAWFDSFAGDHTPTIEAVQAIPPYVRRFSWDGAGG